MTITIHWFNQKNLNIKILMSTKQPVKSFILAFCGFLILIFGLSLGTATDMQWFLFAILPYIICAIYALIKLNTFKNQNGYFGIVGIITIIITIPAFILLFLAISIIALLKNAYKNNK